VNFTGTAIGPQTLTATFTPDVSDTTHLTSIGNYGLTVQSHPAKPGVFKPDLLIKGQAKGARYIGNNFYEGSGSHQRIHQFVKQGGRTWAWVKVQNDGKTKDAIVVGGRVAQAGFKATYWFNGKNISTKIAHHGYTFTLAPGAQRVIKIVVHAFPTAAKGKERSWQVIGRSTGNPLKRDVVKFTTTVR